MKRTISILLFLVMACLIAACSSSNETGSSDAENGRQSNEAEEQTNESDEEGNNDEEINKEDESEGIGVDKGVLNVEVTLPASLFADQDIDEVIANAKEDGVEEVIKNDNGSLTYKMSKSTYNDMMKEMEESLLQNLEDMKSSGDFVSVKDITHNKSFSEFTMIVDQEAYENSFDGFAAFGLGITGLYYQAFDGVSANDLKVTIHIENADSGDIFNTIVYPDDFDQ